MRFLLIYFLVFFFLTTKANSDVTKKIINNLEKSNNYTFKFTQKINKKKKLEIVF